MIQSNDAPRQNAWTHEEEIVLAKGWVDVSENSMLGNSRKEAGFWCAALAYMESQTKQYGRRTTFNTDFGEASINLNTNVGDNDEDEVQEIRRQMGRDKARDAAKKKGRASRALGSSSINNEALARDKARDAAKKKGRASRALGSSSINNEALARLMVTEMTTQEKE
ncbi:hypothetical protein Tco_0770144 [Tanacetum coccineum]|uniref:Uncharacterized protein n=1 Tax=Tanacetum coccineum TaxID=301880 RepID=A0ABQ4ZBE3_9ASTR